MRKFFFHSFKILFFFSSPSLSFISLLIPPPHSRAQRTKKTHLKQPGWEFDSKGACARIPQVEDDLAAKATALASPRCRVRSYPVCVKAGLVFVWPDADPGAAERAARAAPPPVPAEVVAQVEESGW